MMGKTANKLATLAVILATVTSVSAAVTCPKDHEQPVRTNGKRYKLLCGRALGSDTRTTLPASSIEECAELCAKTPKCLHAQFNWKKPECVLVEDLWRPDPSNYAGGHVLWFEADETPPPPPPNNNNGQQQPIGGNTGNNAGANNNNNNNNNAGNGLDALGNKINVNCPADDGEMYTTADGKVFKLHCDKGSYVAGIPGAETDQPNLKACMDACAARSDCLAVDYQPTSKKCYPKGATATPSSWSGHSWVSQSCPKVRTQAINPKPAQTKDLSCPQNDGKIFEGSDGTWFYNQCCADTAGASILDFAAAKDQKDCLEQCVALKDCKSAIFVEDSNGQAENCKFYGHGAFSTTQAEGAHYMFVTDPPTEKAKVSEAKKCSTECPYADGQIYASVTGQNFQMFCKKRHGTNYLKIERRPSFETCLASCGATPGCDSVDYEPRTQKCFFSNNNNLPTIDSPAFMSAHSLGCAGACAQCNKDGCKAAASKPLEADEPSCPDTDGRMITAGLMDFRFRCKKCFNSSGSFTKTTAKSHSDCAAKCAKDTSCVGANFRLSDGYCSLHPEKSSSGQRVDFVDCTDLDSMAPFERAYADMDQPSQP